MKTLAKVSIQAVCIACTIFTALGIVFDVITDGAVFLENWSFTEQAVGTVLVGIGFGVPSLIYESDRLPFAFKVVFHMGIGCAIYMMIGLNVGWIPTQFGWGSCLVYIMIELMIAFLIWIGFAVHYRKLAKNMNEKIRQKEMEQRKQG